MVNKDTPWQNALCCRSVPLRSKGRETSHERRHPDASKTDNAGVIAPPPIIFGGALLAALITDWVIDGPGVGPDYALLVGARLGFLTLGGLALVFIGVVQFRRADTPIEPWKPSTTLVTTGLYRFSRNPIYLGMTLAYIGLTLLADSLLALVVLPLVLIFVRFGVIEREERYLEGKFREAYRAYKGRVRRWI